MDFTQNLILNQKKSHHLLREKLDQVVVQLNKKLPVAKVKEYPNPTNLNQLKLFMSMLQIKALKLNIKWNLNHNNHNHKDQSWLVRVKQRRSKKVVDQTQTTYNSLNIIIRDLIKNILNGHLRKFLLLSNYYGKDVKFNRKNKNLKNQVN